MAKRKGRGLLSESLRGIVTHSTIGGVVLFSTSLSPEHWVNHFLEILENALHFDVPGWVSGIWMRVIIGAVGLLLVMWNFTRTKYLIPLRRTKLRLVRLLAKLARRTTIDETYIRSSRDAKEILATLVSAMEDDVPSDGISPLRCFRRWVVSERTIYRVEENATVLRTERADYIIHGGPKGFYSIFFLREKTYEELKRNFHYDDLHDRHMAELGPFATRASGDRVWLFVLDFEMIRQDRNVIPTYLAIDMMTILARLVAKNQEVAGIAALASTKRGEALCRRFGFRDDDSEEYLAGEKGNYPWRLFHMERAKLMNALNAISQRNRGELNRLVQRTYVIDENIRSVMKAAFKEFWERNPRPERDPSA